MLLLVASGCHIHTNVIYWEAQQATIWMLVCAQHATIRMLVCAQHATIRMLVYAQHATIRMLVCAQENLLTVVLNDAPLVPEDTEEDTLSLLKV